MGGIALGAAPAASIGVPQPTQNFVGFVCTIPHFGHFGPPASTTGCPHDVQNFRPPLTSLPHPLHFAIVILLLRFPARYYRFLYFDSWLSETLLYSKMIERSTWKARLSSRPCVEASC